MKYISKLIIVTFLLAGLAGFAAPVLTSAAALPVSATFGAVVCNEAGTTHPVNYNGDTDDNSCCPTKNTNPPTGKSCLFDKYINPLVNLLSALVGVVVVGSMIWAGIQYSASAGDPGKASAAKQRIMNSLLALAAFIFLYAFLQWIIPGGVSFT